MLRLRQWPLLVVALLACLAPLGCGSSGHTTAGSAAAVGSVTTGGGSAAGGSATTGDGSTPGGSVTTGGGSHPGGSVTTGGGSGSHPGGSVTTGGGGVPGAPGANGSGGAQGAPGGNGQNGGGGGQTAPGAPIKIPDIIQLFGRPINDAMNSLKYGVPLPGESNSYNGIIAQCGGTLCVNLATKVDPNKQSLSSCVASGVTEPSYDSVVPRGSTIWVLTGGAPCEPWETPYPPPSSPSGGQSSSASPGGGQSSSTSPGGDPSSSASPSGGQSSASPSAEQSPVATSSP